MRTAWDSFFDKQIEVVLKKGNKVLDIGSGLRVDKNRGNIVSKKRAWIQPFLESLTYHVMDPVDTYYPDIVGDIHDMPLNDDSYDSIICLAVLEHVSKPWIAANEIYRVLKKGWLYSRICAIFIPIPSNGRVLW